MVLGDRGTARRAQREARAGLRTYQASFSEPAEDRNERAQGAPKLGLLGVRSACGRERAADARRPAATPPYNPEGDSLGARALTIMPRLVSRARPDRVCSKVPHPIIEHGRPSREMRRVLIRPSSRRRGVRLKSDPVDERPQSVALQSRSAAADATPIKSDAESNSAGSGVPIPSRDQAEPGNPGNGREASAVVSGMTTRPALGARAPKKALRRHRRDNAMRPQAKGYRLPDWSQMISPASSAALSAG